MKSIRVLLVSVLFLLLANSGFSQIKKDTLRVLMVGNSYTFFSNMPRLVSQISDSTDVKLLVSTSIAGGARLSDHFNGKRKLKSKQIIKDGKFDVVVLQEQSMGTIENKDEFLEYSKKLCDVIKSSGAKPYFYVTWARQKVPQYQEIITKAYQQAAKENNAGLILVGEAWKSARTLRPDIQLFVPDGSHPSDLGAFLTACTFVKTLTGTLPKKLPNKYFVETSDGGRIKIFKEHPLDIVFCQMVVQDL